MPVVVESSDGTYTSIALCTLFAYCVAPGLDVSARNTSIYIYIADIAKRGAIRACAPSDDEQQPYTY